VPPKSLNPKPRGRPRDASAREEVLAAASALLDEGGLPAVTMDRLASRTGVGKPTIYRTWPNAMAVAFDVLLARAEGQRAKALKGNPRAALRAQLRAIADIFTTPMGRSIALLIAAAQSETELAKAFRNRFLIASREEGRGILERGIKEGAFRADLDLETALDIVYAPLYFRLLIGHQPIDAAFVDRLLDGALHGLAAAKAP
jgi:AcrR family transcriptional regulator